MANTHCDYKLKYINDEGNQVTVDAYFCKGEYMDIINPITNEVINTYVRNDRIDEIRLVTLFYDYNPVSIEQIKQDLYDILLEEKGNLEVINACIP